jgi:DeoR/GlpR family transcriptional regulator of sugar metabolism
MASIIRPGQCVFIDAGSSNLAAARSVPQSIGLTVATHDPTIAAVLAERTDLTLITIGGQVNPLIGAAVDGRALRQVLELRQISSCCEYARSMRRMALRLFIVKMHR